MHTAKFHTAMDQKLSPTLMRTTDAELVEAALTGDKAAFGQLVRRYQGLVYALAYHRLGNFADAQDVAQEVFVKAFRRLGQLEHPEQFATWVKSATMNECKMWLRTRRGTVPLQEAEGEGDVRGITLAVGQSSPTRPYVMFWTRIDDLDEIIKGALPHRNAESAKGRALNSALDLLKALGVELDRVILRLTKDRKCRASVEIKQGKKEFTVDMRPSDAMGLAARAGAPIMVEEAVVNAGNVGEDDVPVPDQDMNPVAYNEEYERLRQQDAFSDKIWEMGLSPEELVDTVRFRKDEAAGVLRVWLEAFPEREATFDLKDYTP